MSFDVLELLGHGGCASVYLCREKNTNNLVALKKISRDRVHKPEQMRRMEAEQYLLENVQHPFLCSGHRLLDLEDDSSNEIVFVLDYIEDAKPLYQCIWNYRTLNRFPEHIAKYFTSQLVLAIGQLHSLGYIHRDLKSGNVLLDKHGISHVIDYGFAKCVKTVEEETNKDGRTWSICGTHYVMAPEMYTRHCYGFEVDWWALGVMIHEMIAGKPPWAYRPLDTTSLLERYFDQITSFSKQCTTLLVDVDVTDECRDVVRSLLQFNRNHRLGHRGVSEVMAHPWFHGVDWDVLQDFKSRRNELEIPYSLAEDFNTSSSVAANALMSTGVELSSSSAESIDEADNLKYFADF